MNTTVHPRDAGFLGRHCWFLSVAWLLIALKCVLVTWAIDRWAVPIDPLWVVAPTVLFAALATFVWVTHRD